TLALLDGLSACCGVRRLAPHAGTAPLGGRDRDLSAHLTGGTGIVRLQPDDVGDDLQGGGRQRQDASRYAEQPAHQVQRGDRVTELLSQGGNDEVADRVAGQGPAATEAVLSQRRP